MCSQWNNVSYIYIYSICCGGCNPICFILWFYNRVVSIAMFDYQMVIDGFITHTLY